MKVLLTGAGGLLGRALTRHGPSSWEWCACTHAELDITDADAVEHQIRRSKPDAVFNCAAYTHVDRAETEAELARAVNVIGAGNLAQATQRNGVPLVHFSTDFVFDGQADQPYMEEHPTNPISTYGRTKWEGEQEIRAHNPDHLIIRTAWLYGDDGHGFPQKLIEWAQEGAVRVSTDQTGSPTYAPHLVAAVIECMTQNVRGTIHLAGSGHATRYQWAEALFNTLGLETELHQARSADFPTPARRPAWSTLGSSHPSNVRLPDWTDGTRDFARHLASSSR